MDVASWLRNLGLERYEAAFRENDVDSEVLCNLSRTNLEAGFAPRLRGSAAECGNGDRCAGCS
jgi:hypothetical protein